MRLVTLPAMPASNGRQTLRCLVQDDQECPGVGAQSDQRRGVLLACFASQPDLWRVAGEAFHRMTMVHESGFWTIRLERLVKR